MKYETSFRKHPNIQYIVLTSDASRICFARIAKKGMPIIYLVKIEGPEDVVLHEEPID